MGFNSPFDLLVSLEKEMETQHRGSNLGEQLGSWRGVLFTVAGIHHIAPIQDICEIIPFSPILSVPGVEPWVKGVAHIRGDLMLINDLGLFMYGKATKKDKHARILIIEDNHEKIGFLVSQVHKMLTIQEKNIMATESEQPIKAYVGKTVKGMEKTVILIELKTLAYDPQFLQISRAMP